MSSQLIRVLRAIATSVLALCAACSAPAASFSSAELDQAEQRIRPQATNAEWNDFIENCLAEKGATSWVRRVDGGFEADNALPSEELAMDECQAEVKSRFPIARVPASPAEFAVPAWMRISMPAETGCRTTNCLLCPIPQSGELPTLLAPRIRGT